MREKIEGGNKGTTFSRGRQLIPPLTGVTLMQNVGTNAPEYSRRVYLPSLRPECRVARRRAVGIAERISPGRTRAVDTWDRCGSDRVEATAN
ncbi:MAG: hypothetical protein KDD67_13300 [Ignavibacteriae bacterium]|nr:hypothetical protein [Ignavibacteriota bacterium]MCB9217076.1 hypothetical protein [Ignavibacteria bacterium]